MCSLWVPPNGGAPCGENAGLKLSFVRETKGVARHVFVPLIEPVGSAIRAVRSAAGVMYGRRSQSKRKQENSFAYQVEVAMKRSRDVNVPLVVDAALIAEAERTGVCNIGDLYVDEGISGSELNRPGVGKLIADLQADRTISHVFVHKRDRCARPHCTSDGTRLEEEILEFGG